MTDQLEITGSDVLLVVDVQNDFCSAGALAIPHADDVVAPINRLAEKFEHVVLTQDWHPRDHLSFASSHPARKPFDVIAVEYGPQTLWPDHCVQGTSGAAFHPNLSITRAELVLRKGYRRSVDSYSVIRENDRRKPTGLAAYLRERGLRRVFLAGLAFDFCVRYSAEDARREGFEVFVVEDCCRSIDTQGSLKAAQDSLQYIGAHSVSMSAIGTTRLAL